MTQPTKIDDCMHRNPLTIHKDTSLAEAVQLIVDNRLTGLTVTDDDGHICGVLSELDCLQGILAAIYNEGDPDHALVNQVMSTDINTCAPGDNIVEVAQAMLETRQRRRPVVVDGRLVGQVSSSNILWALMEHSRRKRFDA